MIGVHLWELRSSSTESVQLFLVGFAWLVAELAEMPELARFKNPVPDD
jgi:hypothetical protein